MATTNKDAIVSALRCLYADNFVTYYKSHGFHFNVEGPTFAQDHALLNEIYDFLYEQHDMLGEQIRQLDKPAPSSLKAILGITEITETASANMSSKSMFDDLTSDFEMLIRNGQWLYEAAGESGYGGLETLIGDYLKDLSKLNWKVKATLSRSFK
jgi:starvation-inducible DNA-binding protein